VKRSPWWRLLAVTAGVVGLVLPMPASQAVSPPSVARSATLTPDCVRRPEPYVQQNADVPAMGALIVDGVTTDGGLTALFGEYAAATRHGWTGGDSTFSVSMPDGRTLWIFSDTFLGPLNADGTRPTAVRMVNNTFVVQDGDRLVTVHGGTPAAPAALLPPPGPDRWYWAGDGQVAAGQVQVIFQEYARTGPDPLAFTFVRNVLATFSPENLGVPASVDALPSASGVAWGSAVLPADGSGDGYTYVYGVLDAPVDKKMRVARVPGGDLKRGRWQYRTASGWSGDESAAADVVSGVTNEYSVIVWNGHFLLVTQDGTRPFSGRITASMSVTPFGPFVNRSDVYQTPESGRFGTYLRSDVATYNAHAHSQVRVAGSVLISYNVNEMTGGAMSSDPGIYRPRFVNVRLRHSEPSSEVDSWWWTRAGDCRG
jgi:hypothetical protein